MGSRLPLWLLLCLPILRAQNKIIEIRSAAELHVSTVNGEEVRELKGDVHFIQRSAEGSPVRVWCDRALRFMAENKIDLFGRVKIVRDSITITAPEGTYFGNERRAEMRKEVHLLRGTTVLTALWGEHFVDERRSNFYGNVVLVDSNSTIYAQQLYYDEQLQRSIAVTDVRVIDREQRTTIYGDSLVHYEAKKFTDVLKRPKLVQYDSTAAGMVDTTVVISKRMEIYQDSVRRFFAIDGVLMTRGELSARCGWAVFFPDSDRIRLSRQPYIWQEGQQISGDSILIRMEQRALRSVFVRGHAMLLSRADSLRRDRFNQLSGRQLTMQFVDGKIQRVDVERNATSLYYLADDAKPNGLNKSSGDRIAIEFAGGQLQRTKVMGGVQGQYFPEKMIRRRESDYNLDGFKWMLTRPRRRGLDLKEEPYE